MLKFIKLFEEFSKMQFPEFSMPNSYELPKGLSEKGIYVLQLNEVPDNDWYILADYETIKKIYKALNIYLIAEEIEGYYDIFYGNNTREEVISRKQKIERSFEIRIVAEAYKDGGPYWVYFGKQEDWSLAQLKDIAASCQVCGIEPRKDSLVPGDSKKNDSGEQRLIIFDQNRELNLTPLYFDSKTKWDQFYGKKDENNLDMAFYVKFEKPSLFMDNVHPGDTAQYDYRFLDKFLVNPSALINLLKRGYEYLDTVAEEIKDRNNREDFISSVMSALVDVGVSANVLSFISSKLQAKEDYESGELVNYYRIPVTSKVRRMLDWSGKNFSKEYDAHQGSFHLGVIDDRKILDYIISNLPEKSSDIIDLINSKPDSYFNALGNYYAEAKLNGEETVSGQRMKEILNYNVYLIDYKNIENATFKKVENMDFSDFNDQTNCIFEVGILDDISYDYIKTIDPLDLYISIFYGFKK
jgi:hypothetical protein